MYCEPHRLRHSKSNPLLYLHDQTCTIKYVMQAKQYIRSKVGKRDLIKNMYACVILCLYSWNVLRQPKKSTQTYGISKGINCLNPLVQTKQPRHRQEALNGVVTRLGVRSICADVRSAAVAASAAAAAAAVVAAPDASAPGSVEVKGQWWFHTLPTIMEINDGLVLSVYDYGNKWWFI